MIGKITPLVKVAGNRAWLTAVLLHFAGLTASSAVLGLLVASVGTLLLDSDRAAVVPLWLVVGISVALVDLGVVPVRIPEFWRQTPESWRCVFGAHAAAFLWGLDIGQGWTVRIPFAAYYALLAWVLLAATPFQGALILAAYGFGKGMPLLWARLQREPEAQIMITCVDHRRDAGAILGVVTSCVTAAMVATF